MKRLLIAATIAALTLIGAGCTRADVIRIGNAIQAQSHCTEDSTYDWCVKHVKVTDACQPVGGKVVCGRLPGTK